MWDALPPDLQAVVLDAFAALHPTRKFWDPRLLHHLPSRQFLNRVEELFRRSLCYARAFALACKTARENGVNDVIHFVAALTRIGVDHVRLHRRNFPSFLTLSARVHHVVLCEKKRCHDTLRIWCALGYRPSCFHRSVAAEAIHEAKLGREETDRVVALMCILFFSLYKQPTPKVAKAQLGIKSVMHNRLAQLRRLDVLRLD